LGVVAPGRPLLLAVLLATASPAVAYRGIAGCPDLVPLAPAPSRRARRCEAAIGRAGARYVSRLLAASRACLARLQAGAIEGDAEVLCGGRAHPSRASWDLPEDPATASRVEAAEHEVMGRIARACHGSRATAPAGCLLEEPRACIVADQRQHAGHLLAEQYGTAAVVTERGALACQAAVARAGAAFATALYRAHAGCLDRHAGAAGMHLGRRCLGEIAGGAPVAPEDARTARRIERARIRLRRRIGAACPATSAVALDACGMDAGALADCLECSHRREALLLVEGGRVGVADRPTTTFVDWRGLANPVLGLDDRMLKDQAVQFHDGWFYVFASTRFEPGDSAAGTKEQWFFRTRDFRDFEFFLDPDLNPPGTGPGSPDVTRIGGLFHMTYQDRPPGGAEDAREIFLSTSADLHDWNPPVRLTTDLVPGSPLIDGALANLADRFFLVFKDRLRQVPMVARSASPGLDGAWEPPARALAGAADPAEGFAENYQLLEVDGVRRVVATGRDPESPRCANPAYAIYTCDHEPFVFTIEGAGAALEGWARWSRKTHLRVPFEAWNPVMHANTAFLSDWRAHDGFFYLSYAGSADGDRFELRGHGKIGLARSRDLVHWRVAGDLRD
jgi:hypothetical protein